MKKLNKEKIFEVSSTGSVEKEILKGEAEQDIINDLAYAYADDIEEFHKANIQEWMEAEGININEIYNQIA